MARWAQYVKLTELSLLMDEPLRLRVERIEAGTPFQALLLNLGQVGTDGPWPPPHRLELWDPDLVLPHGDDNDGDGFCILGIRRTTRTTRIQE